MRYTFPVTPDGHGDFFFLTKTARTLILLSFFWILWETASDQRFSRRKSQKTRPIRALAHAAWLGPARSAGSQVHWRNVAAERRAGRVE